MVSHFGSDVRVYLTLENREHDPEIVGLSMVKMELRAT